MLRWRQEPGQQRTGETDLRMLENGSFHNCCELAGPGSNFNWEKESGDGTQPAEDSRPFWVAAALSSVLIITTAVDLVGNSLVILSVLRNPKLRNTGNMFLVNLALADLVVALYPYPLILMAILHNGWALGEIHCKASGFVMGLSVIGSVFNITAIAINRYCCICHSLGYKKIFRAWNTVLYISLIWVLTIIALVPNFFVGSLKYDPRIYSCTFNQTASTHYTIAVVVIHFLVPITIVTYCYLRIWVLVIQSRRRVKLTMKPRLKPSEVRNFLTMFAVFVIFAICWAPLNFIGLAVAINPLDMAPRVPDGLFATSYFLAYFNSCLNAIIYGLLNQNFRKEYKKIISLLWIPRLFFQGNSKDGSDGERNKPAASNKDQPIETNVL
ncbi:melatonin receptor type 1B [Gracilinanus agilis]|uniref:melatonin receptor type 1B n=1 Tax=Gracilinanus agilis TaxID=191870 RepID=UPI001CFEFF05|nr:melatonin receptor type 1B [Gracilinanus agilis]